MASPYTPGSGGYSVHQGNNNSFYVRGYPERGDFCTETEQNLTKAEAENVKANPESYTKWSSFSGW